MIVLCLVCTVLWEVNVKMQASLVLVTVRADREEVFNNSRKSDGGLMPIERDDWPGPPEPAAAYPELCKYKCYVQFASFMCAFVVTVVL
jgi:hypothetical protein